MTTFNSFEDEINHIRLKIYEETKNLSGQKFHDYFRIPAEAAAKKYGFKIVDSVDTKRTEKNQDSE
ncbi:MAG: hypothetical protein LBS60_09620 [Deltaproteobacteria bacterium]|jgi:hypothetical protein|nr:hypothetical protein [Deltaproteobacteria bacterium]